MNVDQIAGRNGSGVGERPILSVSDLCVRLGGVDLVKDVAFDINPKEIVGLVGESGSGKTLTGLSLLRLLPGRSLSGSGRVLLHGDDLFTLSDTQLRKVRGRKISMIFQEPMTALDPVFSVGRQISETIQAHMKYSARQAKALATEALADVGIPSPHLRFDAYPHELSGGMRQRVMIAMALVCEPSLLIADEPTTALDVTIQAQIMDLILAKCARQGAALLLITHDLGVVSSYCSRVITMYAGEVVEDSPVEMSMRRPLHPYTSGLLRSAPRLSPRKSMLPVIRGRVPGASEMPAGCRFAPRCDFRSDPCGREQSISVYDVRRVRCWKHEELKLSGVK